jgi:hypothetical protein
MDDFDETLNRAMEKAITTLTGGATKLAAPRAGPGRGRPDGQETAGDAIDKNDKKAEDKQRRPPAPRRAG